MSVTIRNITATLQTVTIVRPNQTYTREVYPLNYLTLTDLEYQSIDPALDPSDWEIDTGSSVTPTPPPSPLPSNVVSTDDLVEGSQHLYFTDTRAQQAVKFVNIGNGLGLFKDLNAGKFELYSLTAGPGIAVTQSGNDLVVSNTGTGGGGSSALPASSAPPDITTAGNVGTQIDSYALADHTHRGVLSVNVGANSPIYGSVVFQAGSNITMLQSGSTITIASTASGSTGVASLAASGQAALTGAVTLTGGTNVTLAQAGNNITINSTATSNGVSSFAAFGQSSLTGAVTISAGSNVSLLQTGNNIAISATSSGGMAIGGLVSGGGLQGNLLFTDSNSKLSMSGFLVWDTTHNRLGVGTASPAQMLSVTGVIQSTTGGFMFPDGTTQTTAATGGSNVTTEILTFYSGNVVVKASGTSADLAAITVTKDFATTGQCTLILNLPASVIYHSVNVTFLASETSGCTVVALQAPDMAGATTPDTAMRPFALRLNSSFGVGGTTSTFALVSGSTFITQLSGYTSGAEQKAAFFF